MLIRFPPPGTLDYVYVVIPTGFVAIPGLLLPKRCGPDAFGGPSCTGCNPAAGFEVDERCQSIRALHATEAGRLLSEPDPNDPQNTPVEEDYQFSAGYAPGMPGSEIRHRSLGETDSRGSDIVLQLHYTPNGKSTVSGPNPRWDPRAIAQSCAAKAVLFGGNLQVLTGRFRRGTPNYEAKASMTFGEPVELVFIQPHMHVRGKDMTVRLTYPGRAYRNTAQRAWL